MTLESGYRCNANPVANSPVRGQIRPFSVLFLHLSQS